MFSELCKDMDADAVRLLYHAEVQWLSRGKILKCVFQLRQELCVFLDQHKHPMTLIFKKTFGLQNCPICVQYLKKQISEICRCKEMDLIFLKQTVRLKPSNKS